MHTGDIANLDAEGYVQITDRKNDAIKSGGEWISSLQLESLLSQHPGVSEVAVVGVADEKWGERPVALVVPDERFASDLSDASLREHRARKTGRVSHTPSPAPRAQVRIRGEGAGQKCPDLVMRPPPDRLLRGSDKGTGRRPRRHGTRPPNATRRLDCASATQGWNDHKSAAASHRCLHKRGL